MLGYCETLACGARTTRESAQPSGSATFSRQIGSDFERVSGRHGHVCHRTPLKTLVVTMKATDPLVVAALITQEEERADGYFSGNPSIREMNCPGSLGDSFY